MWSWLWNNLFAAPVFRGRKAYVCKLSVLTTEQTINYSTTKENVLSQHPASSIKTLTHSSVSTTQDNKTLFRQTTTQIRISLIAQDSIHLALGSKMLTWQKLPFSCQWFEDFSSFSFFTCHSCNVCKHLLLANITIIRRLVSSQDLEKLVRAFITLL